MSSSENLGPRPLAQTVTRSVTQELELAFVDDLEDGPLVKAEFRYSSSDPFAVSVSFDTSQGLVTWSFARELLAEGLHEPSGEGDVHVWPTLDELGGSAVIIELCPPEGGVLLQADTRALITFLARTETVVRTGREADHVDVDAALRALFAATHLEVEPDEAA